MKRISAKWMAIFLPLLFFPTFAFSWTLGLEVFQWNPADQDVVLGTSVNTIPTDNDILGYGDDIGGRVYGIVGSWRLSYLRYTAADNYDVSGRGGTYFVALDHPSASYGGYDRVNADGDLKLSKIDVDYLIDLTTSSPGSVKVFFGISSVQYSNEYSADYDIAAQLINRKAENSLFGVRTGIEASGSIAATNARLNFYGRAAVGVLAGDSSVSHSESSGNLQRDLDWDSTVPLFEAEFGFKYKFGAYVAYIGYSLLRMEDVASAQLFFDDNAVGTQLQQGEEAGFDGLKVGVEIPIP